METSVVNNLRHGLNDISETMPLAMARQIRIPLFWETVPAGAPEHREGYVDEYIDFYKYFIKNPDDLRRIDGGREYLSWRSFNCRARRRATAWRHRDRWHQRTKNREAFIHQR